MHWKILQGHALDVLRSIPDESVHCCVTSPPYYGLRDYGTEPVEWEPVDYPTIGGTISVPRMQCSLGLEPEPGAFVGHIVSIFREVKRVLDTDGTCWLNFGDSYANDGKWGGHTGGKHAKALHDSLIGRNKKYTGLKPKDLIGIPWLIAFALRADGWYLRQDCIWHKSNPMPESVLDRPTRAHEYIFLLSKSKCYRYDADAVKEPVSGNAHARGNGVNPKAKKFGPNSKARVDHSPVPRPRQNESFSAAVCALVTMRNRRTVWTVATCPTPEAHFATYPPDLIEPCILASSPERGTVLDPFAGAGTTGLAAIKNGRSFIGIELKPEYIEIAHQRAQKYYPLLMSAAHEENQ